MPLDPETLKRHLHYEPSTGVFTRLTRASNMRPGSVAGSVRRRDGYVDIRLLGMKYSAHRLAWFYMHGKWPVGEIDHINREHADNRISNLRDVPHMVNMTNLPPRSDPRHGVYWDGRKGGRWYGMFKHQCKTYYAGSSRSRDEAIRLVELKKKEIIGDRHV